MVLVLSLASANIVLADPFFSHPWTPQSAVCLGQLVSFMPLLAHTIESYLSRYYFNYCFRSWCCCFCRYFYLGHERRKVGKIQLLNLPFRYAHVNMQIPECNLQCVFVYKPVFAHLCMSVFVFESLCLSICIFVRLYNPTWALLLFLNCAIRRNLSDTFAYVLDGVTGIFISPALVSRVLTDLWPFILEMNAAVLCRAEALLLSRPVWFLLLSHAVSYKCIHRGIYTKKNIHTFMHICMYTYVHTNVDSTIRCSDNSTRGQVVFIDSFEITQ